MEIRRQTTCRVPYSRRALFEESEIYIAIVFKFCKAVARV